MISRNSILSASVVAAVVFAYILGREFIRADHYGPYWVIMILSLAVVAAIIRSTGKELRAKSGWAIGLGLGLVVSFVVMFALLALSSEDFLAEMPADAERVGIVSLITYWATLSVVHFGWVPYLVLFGFSGIIRKGR